MKFGIYFALIITALCCVIVTADFDRCFGQYLRRKGKLDNNLPLPRETSYCNAFVSSRLQKLQSLVYKEIRKHNPNEYYCLTSEFENVEILDLVVKLAKIKDSLSLNVSEKRNQIDVTFIELKKDLEKIAVRCETNKEKFSANLVPELIELSMGIPQLINCFLKNVEDNKILPLENIESYGLATTYANCDEVLVAARRE